MACTSERPFWGVPDRGSCPSWRLGRLEPPRTRVAEPSARGTPAHWLIRRAALRRPSPDLESCGTGAQLAFVLPFTGVGLRAARRSPSFASSRLWTEVVVVPGPRGAHTGTPFPPPCFHCSPPSSPRPLQAPYISEMLRRQPKQSPVRMRLSWPYCPGMEKECLPFSNSRAHEGLVSTTKLSKFRVSPPTTIKSFIRFQWGLEWGDSNFRS